MSYGLWAMNESGDGRFDSSGLKGEAWESTVFSFYAPFVTFLLLLFLDICSFVIHRSFAYIDDKRSHQQEYIPSTHIFVFCFENYKIQFIHEVSKS